MTDSTNIADPPMAESIINIGAKRKSAFGGITNQWKGHPQRLDQTRKNRNFYPQLWNLSAKVADPLRWGGIIYPPKSQTRYGGAAFPQKCPKKRELFHLFYPPKSQTEVYRRVGFIDESGLSAKGGPQADYGGAAFLHFFAGFSIPFTSFINCFMKNEPNYNTPNRKLEIENRKSLQILLSKSLSFSSFLTHFFSQKARTFPIIYPPNAAFCRFLPLSINDTLNSIHNKDLHKFLSPKYGPRTTTDERRIMQNEPNFNHRAPRDERRKNAKRTQIGSLR